MEWVYILVGAAAVVWWVTARGERQRGAREKSERLAERETRTKLRAKSPEEKLEDSLGVLREAIREKAAADTRVLREQLEDANERLAAALSLADRLGISKAVPKIAEEMRHWPSWSGGDNLSKYLVDGLTYSGSHGSANEFVMRGTTYRLSLANEHMSPVPDSMTRYAEVWLERNDGTRFHLVFAAEIAKDIMREFAPWRVHNVTRIELGDWVHDMVMLDELFSARRERDSLAFQLEHTLPKVKDLKS